MAARLLLCGRCNNPTMEPTNQPGQYLRVIPLFDQGASRHVLAYEDINMLLGCGWKIGAATDQCVYMVYPQLPHLCGTPLELVSPAGPPAYPVPLGQIEHDPPNIPEPEETGVDSVYNAAAALDEVVRRARATKPRRKAKPERVLLPPKTSTPGSLAKARKAVQEVAAQRPAKTTKPSKQSARKTPGGHGSAGGVARAMAMTPAERSAAASKASRTRWGNPQTSKTPTNRKRS